ncbi:MULTISPECIES: DUF3095 domain-containing protein [unclassified Leptolyngbya]|uniref:DUF3095 domain-containing protein n=1 Tax=unclassified Leptolyngbya TaxID=2650499 RepID=UPI001688F522|nr:MULTISPECIES: DUF3095 domain-containing protein [unclassified Leptolyngbya]MBD1909542.1 DUF3095 domain-containing protein [Leptolyngbya sp. FACHB-8]MBD2154080.1 DUF3095 domain-containing protein [Leptolyngbya sp. FACHB-16]
MVTDFFYAELPTLKSFWDIVNPDNFTSIPDDWYILITDITNSTPAIAQGKYKMVTFLGASSIAVVLNEVKGLDIPFVFGGDGMTLVVPPSLLAAAREALLGLRRLARSRFELDLRVGVVPVSVVTAKNYDVKVAKVAVSKHYTQANFSGKGLTYATDLVKDDSPDNPYQVSAISRKDPNFSGLECRWQDIFSATGQTISLMVGATAHSSHSHQQVYGGVIQALRRIYGTDTEYNPIHPKRLRLTFNIRQLAVETQLRVRSLSFLDRLLYLANSWAQNVLGWVFMTLKLNVGAVSWGIYKEGVIATTDFQKFDDMLRMVLVSTAAQTQALTEYLEREFQAGNLVYGLHISDRALMTCVVFERNGRQVHFIDGADGGYTLAAKAMKRRLQKRVMAGVA